MKLAPLPNQWEAPGIWCGNCKEYLSSTSLYRALFLILIFASIIWSAISLDNSDLNLSSFQLTAMVFVGALVYWFVIWPLFLKVKKWQPPYYYLPKSRIVGYFLYLVIPVLFLFGLLFLAAKYEVGF